MCLFLFGGRDLTKGCAALFTKPLLAAIARDAGTGADAFVAAIANEEDVADLDGHLFGEAAALRIFLAAAHVLIDEVDALHDEAARLVVNVRHLAALTLVVAGDDFDGIVGFDV